MEQFLEVYAERKRVMKELLGKKSLFPKEMPEEDMHNVVRYTKQIPKNGRPSVERFPVWSNKLVKDLLGQDFGSNGVGNARRNIELVVPGLVPESEYIKIKECADLGNYRIINPREFPFYPKALWVKVSCMRGLDCICRQFPQQIILVDVDNSIHYEYYRQILFQALACGYIVVNHVPWEDSLQDDSPWVRNENRPRDDSLFELELYTKIEEISEVCTQCGQLENFNQSMEWEWKERVDVLWLLSEEKGRDRAHAEIMASRKATIESLDEKIVLLHDKLNYYETILHDVFSKYRKEAGKFCEEGDSLSFELREEREEMTKAGDALKSLREELERRQTDITYGLVSVRDAVITCSREEAQGLQDKLQWHGSTLQILHSNGNSSMSDNLHHSGSGNLIRSFYAHIFPRAVVL